MGARIAKLFGKGEPTRILLTGLDAAGKTTILYRMKLGEVVTTIPTIGFNVETIKWKNVSFSAWDLGGRDKIRQLHRHYFPGTHALIYVVDSTDHERMSEAKEELKSYTDEYDLNDAVIVVFANKQDLADAKSVPAISEALELHKIRQHIHVIPTVATLGAGLDEGLEWIAEMLNSKHLPKGAEEVLQLKDKNQKLKNENAFSYFKSTWNFLHALFVGSEEPEELTK